MFLLNNRLKKKALSLVVLIVATSIVYVFFPDTKTDAVAEGVLVVSHVADGDTITVCDRGFWDGERCADPLKVRLIGVNTPESVDPRREVQCFGLEASAYTKNLLPLGTVVTLENDPSKPDKDTYGRLLRYVYKVDGDIFINQALIANGYAYQEAYGESYAFKQTFIDAERKAKAEKRGLWSPDTCNGKK